MTLLEFASAMEKELIANTYKGGWHSCSVGHLLRRLEQETKELRNSIKENRAKEVIVGEAADVANFCMMISDRYEQKE